MRLRPPRSRAMAGMLGAVLVAAVTITAAGHAADAAPRVPHPATPSRLPAAIESLGGYVEQTACDPTIRPGTRKLADLLARTYKSYGGSTWASTYACGTDGTRSEHYDGRAIDWMVGVSNKRQHEAALATIHWLLATDSHGNRFAMARRLGVMYLIYDNRMWGAWDGKWEPYGNCAHEKGAAYANACHRTHIHISLTWNGAMGRTTFWTRTVSPTDYGPCRQSGLNWAGRYKHANLSPCTYYPLVTAPKKSSSTKKALVYYSGSRVHRGSRGPAVDAVQRALHLSVSDDYTSATKARVKTFQRAHHLGASGVMNADTWRALLAATH